MPKKSKVNKLARMSDEERARYLQHRADVEEEARRRKRELVSRFIKNKLEKEEIYSRMNAAKLNQIWRYILRRVKCKQMALDIQGMMSTFKFMVERKGRLLTTLMNAIEDSDHQHRRIFQAHTENISYFLSIGTQRLDKLQAEYERQKNALLVNWEREESTINDGQKKAEFKLRLITFIQRQDFKLHKKEKELARATRINDAWLEMYLECVRQRRLRQLHVPKQDKNAEKRRLSQTTQNIENKKRTLASPAIKGIEQPGETHEEELRILRTPKELEIEQFRNGLKDLYQSYVEEHNPVMEHYRSLREKDEFYQRDIARNEHQIRQANKILTSLQKEYTKITTTIEEKLTRMNEHKESLSKQCWQMKRNSKTQSQRAEEMMLVLVDASQEAIKNLEEAKKKFDKIKQLSEICGKYETESDNRPLRAETDDNERIAEFENLDEAMIKECKEYSKMDKFMLKVNHVRVQTMCLKAEKAKLTKENSQLKLYIKRYLTELALKNERQRPISVQLQSETRMDVKVPRPVTCIEGALSNAVMHQKRMSQLRQRNKELEVRAYPRLQNWMEAS